jgi:hypothetical protein
MRLIAICRRCPQYSEFVKEERVVGAGVFRVLKCHCARDRQSLPERMFKEQRLPFYCDLSLEQVVVCFGGET